MATSSTIRDDVCDGMLFNTTIFPGERPSLVDQYVLFVETADTVIGRRLEWNKFFISANVLFVTLLAGFTTGSFVTEIGPSILIVASALGIVRIEPEGVTTQRLLATAAIRRLPGGNGENRYGEFDVMERSLPGVFFLFYVALFALSLRNVAFTMG